MTLRRTDHASRKANSKRSNMYNKKIGTMRYEKSEECEEIEKQLGR